MCFSKIGNAWFKKTNKPIVCYKYLYKTSQFKIKNWKSSEKYDFISPYYFYGWIHEKKYFSGLTKNDIKLFYKTKTFNNHVFSAFLKKPNHPLILDGYLCKCIIPKNSLYFVSPNNELITNNLIIVGVVKAERNTPEEIRKRNEKK